MSEVIQLTRKDFVSDQTVRWCPGCGDYAILAQMQKVLPELGIPKEKIVFISGIGCSSRFPYYMNTYGIHSIHGRAPTLATGLKIANPMATVLSAAMMFEMAFNLPEEGAAIREAVNKALEKGMVTEDLADGGKAYGTKEVGDWLAANI